MLDVAVKNREAAGVPGVWRLPDRPLQPPTPGQQLLRLLPHASARRRIADRHISDRFHHR
jgi:hypothetical protein